MADIWGEIFKVGIPALAEIAGGWLGSQGDREASDEEADAAREALRLQRDVYMDQRGLARPGYMTGGAATNLLGAQYGIAPQDYTAAYNGLNMGPISGGGYGGGVVPSAANNWGAGQPVAGHSGGGTNGLASGLGSAAGTAIGTTFGGPIGGAIGGALGGAVGGMFRQSGPKGDNWTTLATGAPQGYDYDAYFASDPGLASEWAKPDVRSLFNGNRDAYLYWHSQGGPMNGKQSWEPRQLAPVAGSQPGIVDRGDGTFGPGADSNGLQVAGGTNGLANPMAGFMSSPYGKIAIEGFRGVDQPEISGAFARGGKLLSGAQSIALDERGKARLGGAYQDYTNGLRSLAGLNQTASSQIGGAAGAYGANAGNLIMDAGRSKAEGMRSGYNGLAQGISGAIGGVMDYGKKNWGWT